MGEFFGCVARKGVRGNGKWKSENGKWRGNGVREYEEIRDIRPGWRSANTGKKRGN
jgi:hypothetical protein